MLFNRTHGPISVPNNTPVNLFIARGAHFRFLNVQFSVLVI